jgi:hypothetical protein
MKISTFGMTAIAPLLGLATWIVPVDAQGPLNDEVKVSLPYTVTIGDRTLQPGDYHIRELSGAAKNYVLLIYSDDGMKFETTALTIPTLDQATPEESKVVLHHFGNDYYFDKVWVAGKNYGYEFPLPDRVRQREQEHMQPETVTAVSQAPSPPAVAPAPAPEEPAPLAAPPPAVLMAAPELEAEPQETPAENAAPPPPEPEPASREENGANREMEPDGMPATSAGWVTMLLSGGALSGAGMLLRRKG